MTHDEILATLNAQKEALRPLFSGVDERVARRRPSEGVWSPKEVAVHLREVEKLMRWRIDRILTEEAPLFPDYDPSALPEASTYIDADLPSVIDDFDALRGANLAVVRELPESALARIGVHVARGSLTLSAWLDRWVAHTDHHLSQIKERLGTQ